MNIQGVLTLLVAAACIFAVGVTSTTLDSVETDPSDVFNTSVIPTQSNQPSDSGSSGGGGGGGSSIGDPSGSDVGTEKKQGNPQETKKLPAELDDQRGDKGGGPEKTLWQRLMELLPYIIGAIIAIVGGVVAFKIARDKFREKVTEPEGEIIMEIDTSNDVYESWWEMVDRADIDEIQSKTPQEIAEEAAESGMDPDAVSDLTEVFEEVYYGGREITHEEESRAREAVERIKSEGKRV